jgi:hypothetical protein
MLHGARPEPERRSDGRGILPLLEAYPNLLTHRDWQRHGNISYKRDRRQKTLKDNVLASCQPQNPVSVLSAKRHVG